MKKITTLLFAAILFVTNANAQAKVDSTAKPPEVTANTPILTINDLNRVDSLLKKSFDISQMPIYNNIVAFMQTLVNNRVVEFQKGNAIKPKK